MFNHAVIRPGWLKTALAGLCVLAFAASPVLAQEDDRVVSPWTTSIGAGMHFFEADEERYPGQLYEVRQGYDFTPNLTLEGNVGYHPFFEEKDEPTDGDDTVGMRTGLDLLYHFDPNVDRKWDPYAGISGGAMWFRERRRDTGDHWHALYGPALGLGYALNEAWQLRGDYRLLVAGPDAQINHTALALLTYRWGAEGAEGTEGATKGTIFDEEGRTKLQTVYFDYDSAKLSEPAKQTLRSNATALNADPHRGKKVVIEGHCDERGTDEYNLALGQRRANSAFEFLRSLGVPSDRMSTVSFGEEKPVDPGHNEAAWSKNRRAETVVVNR